jgi:hypothetical protein
MTDVNIWGDAKKELYKNKNYVGYIPSDYKNYGFKISASRFPCNRATQSVEETVELYIDDFSRYEINITCPDSVKLWKFSYKFTCSDDFRPFYRLNYILKGSSDNSNWITFYNSIVQEVQVTREEWMGGRRRPSVFPNMLIENPKSYKYYIFSITLHVLDECLGPEVNFDTMPTVATISNFQMYIMND